MRRSASSTPGNTMRPLGSLSESKVRGPRYWTVSRKYRNASGSLRRRTSRIVTKLPRDLDIFSLSTLTNPLCIQVLAKGPWLGFAASLCAISFSWCGKMRSIPPPWMSNPKPRYFALIAEHSMCQPGRPLPHGLGHP